MPLPLEVEDEAEIDVEEETGVALMGDFGVFAAVAAKAAPLAPPMAPGLMGANENAPDFDDDDDGAAVKHKYPAHMRSMRARARDTLAAA